MTQHYQLPLSVEQLLEKAREISGVDIVDDEAVEPLRYLVASLNRDSRLHKIGVIAKQNKLLRLLCNRLRMMRDFAAHPEISQQKIQRPVFIFGMARSGTTKTHRVISATGDFNYMPFWQVQYPALISGDREESPQQRIDAADAYCRWLDEVAPESKLGHSFETFEAEEDSLLTEQCLIAPSFLGYAEVPSYIEWFATQGMKAVFDTLYKTLQYLQWQGLASADKPWLLKAPTYYGFEPELLNRFPDAHIVMTHRSPLQTVPSLCKLINQFHIPFDDARVDAKALQHDLAATLDLHLANRSAMSELRILDVLFEDVVNDMEAVAEKIYACAGMALTASSREKIRQWGAGNPVHKEGKFVYSLEEFGLCADQIKEYMTGYIAFIESLKNRGAQAVSS